MASSPMQPSSAGSMRRKSLVEAVSELNPPKRGGALELGAPSALYMNILSAVPLLKCLNVDELTLLCDIVEIRSVDAGQSIFRQGDEGQASRARP